MPPPDHTLRPVVYPPREERPITASADAQAIVRLTGLLGLDASGDADHVCWIDEEENVAHWRLTGGIEVTCRVGQASGGAHWHVGTW
jgi:hypothetical protein